jgi:hypothetical protein
MFSGESVNNQPEDLQCNIFVIVFSATYRKYRLSKYLSTTYSYIGDRF